MYYDADNAITLEAGRFDDEQFHFSVTADSSAVLGLMDDTGTRTILLRSGSTSLSLPIENDGTLVANLAPDNCDIAYKPAVFDSTNLPSIFVRFESSPYYLHLDQSEQQITEEGKYLKVESYYTGTPSEANSVTSQSEQALVPTSGEIYLNYSLPNGEKLRVSMNDGGESLYGDTKAADGVFSTIVKLTDAGDYRFAIRADANVAEKTLQREFVTFGNLPDNRVRLASNNANATPNLVLDQTLSNGQYGIPILVNFNGLPVPDYVSVRGEICRDHTIG